MIVAPGQRTLEVRRMWREPLRPLHVDMDASLRVLARALREIDPAAQAERRGRARAALASPVVSAGMRAARAEGRRELRAERRSAAVLYGVLCAAGVL